MAFHRSGWFSFSGLGEPSGLGWDLGFAAVGAEQLVCRLSCFTCKEQALVVGSLCLCHLTTFLTRL